MVEAPQVRKRHRNADSMIPCSRFCALRPLRLQTHADGPGTQLRYPQRGGHGRREAFLTVAGQQLQGLDVLPFAFTLSPLALELPAQLGEGLGQLQFLEQPCLLQISRLALQDLQEVLRFQHMLPGLAAAAMPGHHLTLMHQHHLLRVGLERHRAERHLTG